MNINIIQVIFQIVNFTILLFLLRKYLYRPILKGARLRAQKFEKTLSEKADEEMQKKLQRADRLVATRQKQMETNLQKRFSQAVVTTTESLLKDVLDPKQQRSILGKQIQQLKKV